MTADEILSADQLGEDLEFTRADAVQDRARLSRARDAALQWAAGDLKRSLLVAERTAVAWVQYAYLHSRRGTGLWIDYPDIRDVSKVERTGGDGEAVELTAAELGDLVVGEVAGFQLLAAPIMAERHTVYYSAGIADDSLDWGPIRQAVSVVAGAFIDNQGQAEARESGRRELDAVRVSL